MRSSFKYRIYPTKAQVSNLENQFSMCRHLYNWSLEERKQTYETTKTTVTYQTQQNALPSLKEKKPWYKSVYSQVLQDVLKRVDKGYKAFFRRVKLGETPGFPKFKKKGQWNSITYPQYSVRPENGSLTVPKVGDLKIQYHREIPQNAHVKTLTILKEGGKWFVSFSVEYEFHIEPKDVHTVLALDLGLIDFYYASNGTHVSVPRFFRKSQRRLQKLQRRLSKTEKRTPAYRKILLALQKVHYRIKCQRMDFLHKTANGVLEQANCVVVEDLNIQGLKRRPKPKKAEDGSYLPNGAAAKSGLNKSISDVGWYAFVQILTYKAMKLGKIVLKVAAHYTSQDCSACGTRVKKSLSTRTHRCPECGYSANRDHNAANNILGLGMQSLGVSP